jgi:ankyrin repeat protein
MSLSCFLRAHLLTDSSFALRDENLTRWMLDQGADPNACFVERTPLTVAAEEGSIVTLEMLLERGASIRKGNPLHHAVVRNRPDCLEVIELFLHLGLSVNEVMMYKNWGGTPLHVAAFSGRTEAVAYLLDRGANPHIVTHMSNLTALDAAEERGNKAVVELLSARM